MDEDLYKKYKASCISEINVCRKERQNRSIFCRGLDKNFKEDKESDKEIYKNSETEVIVKALQISDCNTMFFSNIISENNKENNSSPEILVSSMQDDYFEKEYKLNVSKMNRHVIKNSGYDFTFPTDKKSFSIRNKFNSDFRGITEKKLSNKVLRKTICTFPDSYFKNKKLSLKRKFDLCEKNDLDVRLDDRSKNKSKSSAYLKNSDNILSYFKHFKSDESGPIFKSSKEELFFKPGFINERNSVESFKEMKNIEVQSSPIRIRIATNIGEDSIEYVDPTMEVELDSAESDSDDSEEPNEHNNVGNEVEDHQLHSDLAEDSNLTSTETNIAGENDSNPLIDDSNSKCKVKDKEVLNESEKTIDISKAGVFVDEGKTEETENCVMDKDFTNDEKGMEGKEISSVTDLDTKQDSDEWRKKYEERKLSEELNNDTRSKETNGECSKKHSVEGDEKPDMKADNIKDSEPISTKSVKEHENVLTGEYEKADVKSHERRENDIPKEEDIGVEEKCVEYYKDSSSDGNSEFSEKVLQKEKEKNVKKDVEDYGVETAVDSENSESIFEENSEIKENEADISDKASNKIVLMDETGEGEKTESKTNTTTDYAVTVLENENQDDKEILRNDEENLIEPDSCENSSHQITDNEEDSLEKDSLENIDKEETSEEKQIDMKCSENTRVNKIFEKETQKISDEELVIESTETNTEIINIKCTGNSVSKTKTQSTENTKSNKQNYIQIKLLAENNSSETDESEKQQTNVKAIVNVFSLQDEVYNESEMESVKFLDNANKERPEHIKNDSKSPEELVKKYMNDVSEISNDDHVLAEEQTKTEEHQDFATKTLSISVDKEVTRFFEKTNSDKTNQITNDSVKLISPRKGIKVEDDEVETAISSVMFYDEMSDGNEQILNTVSSTERNKPFDGFEIANVTQQPENSKLGDEDSERKLPFEKYNEEHLPFQENVDDVILHGATAEENVSPKKRKKKRKARSRSVQKGGASSASKKTQDSKGSASKNGTRTSRSVSSTSARSPSVGEKKIPPIKAPVGTTPPPKVKQARSKIGSLDNVTHKPKGGDKKVETVKLEWNAKSKVGSLDYVNHKPSGGDKKILTQKVDFKNVQSKVGSKDNLKHKPGGGNLKISTEKLNFKEKAAPKIGSLDNAKHKPGGGNVVVKSEKLHFKEKATSKINSRSGSERGSSHGGSETQSPVMPSSPAPQEELPPLNEDESPSQEEPKPEKADCNGGEERVPEVPSNDASPTKSSEKSENATEDQLIAF